MEDGEETDKLNYSKYFRKIIRYREDYLDTIIEKYGKEDPNDALIDMKTLKVVKNSGNGTVPRFGMLTDYCCKPAQELVTKVAKLTVKDHPTKQVKSSKYGYKNKIEDVSTIYPLENRMVHSTLERNKQRKHNLSQEFDIIEDTASLYKDIPIDSLLSRRFSKEYDHNIKTAKSKNINDMLCDSKLLHKNMKINELKVVKGTEFEGETLFPSNKSVKHNSSLTLIDSNIFSNDNGDSKSINSKNKSYISEVKLSPSYRKLCKRKSKNDTHKYNKVHIVDRDFSVDSTSSSETDSSISSNDYNDSKKVNSKNKCYLPSTNISAEGNLSPKLHNRKPKNDTHKYKKLDSADGDDLSVDSAYSSEASDDTEKSSTASDVCSVDNFPKKCIVLLKKLDTVESAFHKFLHFKDDMVSTERFKETVKPSTLLTDSVISQEKYDDDNKTKNKCVSSKYRSGEDRYFTGDKILRKQNSKNDTSKYKKLGAADQDFNVDNMTLSEKLNVEEKSSISTFLDETLCFNNVSNVTSRVDDAGKRVEEMFTSVDKTSCVTRTSSFKGINEAENSSSHPRDLNISSKVYNNKGERVNILNKQYKQTSSVKHNNPNKQEKLTNVSQLDVCASSKVERSVSSRVNSLPSKRFNYESIAVGDSFMYKHIPIDDSLSIKKSPSKHNKTAKSKSNIEYNLCDFKAYPPNVEIDQLSIKKNGNSEGKNMFSSNKSEKTKSSCTIDRFKYLLKRIQ